MKRVAFLSCAGAALIAMPAVAASLSGRIRSIARALPGVLGVYARTLAEAPPLVAYNASERFPTASIIKVLVMTTAYALDEVQRGVLDEEIVFHSDDLIGGSDFMVDARDGQKFTVRELIVPMITVSDNTAANLLIGHFGVATINEIGARAGMTRTHLARRFLDYTAIAHHNDNLSTPADMGRLLYLIEHGAREGIPTIVSSQHCTAMLDIMLRQTDRDAIPAALPPHVAVANKTGEIEGTRNDIAVVAPFGDSPFILAVMTKDAYDYAACYAAIHAVTRAVYASV
ncbi:MAG TPA: serine hydrolase [Candidatus Cybelea sp.]|nr:serine hydrolase [Candidatus Cybelea sp.]